jgi:hypothetical protein
VASSGARAAAAAHEGIGVLINLPPDDPEVQARIGAFVQGLQELGWVLGQNVRIEYRWAADAASLPRHAAELVALAPDVILANANPSLEALQRVPRFRYADARRAPHGSNANARAYRGPDSTNASTPTSGPARRSRR